MVTCCEGYRQRHRFIYGISPIVQAHQALIITCDESAENSASVGGVIPLILLPRLRAVNFEVRNDVHASRFLLSLLLRLHVVDSTISLMPHPEASSDASPFSDLSIFPKDASSSFVTTYLAGLEVAQSSLVGKFGLSSNSPLKV
jgi:hypothetical protein